VTRPDPTPEAASTPRITVVGKPGCHLCDVAKEVVERVAADTGVGWQELSILDDPGLAEKYWEQIPVILVDGEVHDFYKVDETRLRDALKGRRHWLRRR
jgi:glutaredoxin